MCFRAASPQRGSWRQPAQGKCSFPCDDWNRLKNCGNHPLPARGFRQDATHRLDRCIVAPYPSSGIGRTYTPLRACALCRGLISPHSTLLCSEIGGFAADRGSYTSPATAYAVYPFVYLPEANTLRCKLFPSDKSE